MDRGIYMVGQVTDAEAVQSEQGTRWRVWILVGRTVEQTYGEAAPPDWASDGCIVKCEARWYEGRLSWRHLAFMRPQGEAAPKGEKA